MLVLWGKILSDAKIRTRDLPTQNSIFLCSSSFATWFGHFHRFQPVWLRLKQSIIPINQPTSISETLIFAKKLWKWQILSRMASIWFDWCAKKLGDRVAKRKSDGDEVKRADNNKNQIKSCSRPVRCDTRCIFECCKDARMTLIYFWKNWI